MTQEEAQILAKKLMKKFLNSEKFSDWKFCFDRAKKRFGQCHYQKKIISLSRHLVEINNEKTIRETILHEISHAICGYKAGHGKKWKECIKEIGGIPERCYSRETVNTPRLKYTAFCTSCGIETQRQQKFKTSLFYSAPACKKCCKIHNNGKFSRKFLLQCREN